LLVLHERTILREWKLLLAKSLGLGKGAEALVLEVLLTQVLLKIRGVSLVVVPVGASRLTSVLARVVAEGASLVDRWNLGLSGFPAVL